MLFEAIDGFSSLVSENGRTTLLALVSTFVAFKFLAYRRNLEIVGHMPGMRIPLQPVGIGAALPSTWWNPALFFQWSWRSFVYKQYGNDIFSVVPFLSGKPGFYTANVDVIRQVAGGGHKTSFVKPRSASEVLLLWGMNLIAADGEMWRKHRRIMGPAFNNKLYEMVWRETLVTYHEMVAGEGWKGKEEIDVPVVQRITFKMALLIIGKCGFGFKFNWFDPPRAADGTMSLQESLRIMSDTNMLATLLPKWMQRLPFRKLREMRESHAQLMHFMQGQIAERRSDLRSKDPSQLGSDAFTMLVKANDEEGAKYRLDDQELIGNIFIMLFAGHETTAHTLAATLGLLAYYQDIQQEISEQVLGVIGKDRDPLLEEYSKLNKVLAAFYEALRMFPSGYILIREATEDTTLQIPNPDGQEGTTTIPIARGVQVIGDMVGVQYNPRYFKDPEEFRPSRWYDVSNESEAVSAFSVGPRACIGRKFATLEVVAFLSLLIRDYRILPSLKDGESREQWKARVLQAKIVITLGVEDMPVKLVRRS